MSLSKQSGFPGLLCGLSPVGLFLALFYSRFIQIPPLADFFAQNSYAVMHDSRLLDILGVPLLWKHNLSSHYCLL